MTDDQMAMLRTLYALEATIQDRDWVAASRLVECLLDVVVAGPARERQPAVELNAIQRAERRDPGRAN